MPRKETYPCFLYIVAYAEKFAPAMMSHVVRISTLLRFEMSRREKKKAVIFMYNLHAHYI